MPPLLRLPSEVRLSYRLPPSRPAVAVLIVQRQPQKILSFRLSVCLRSHRKCRRCERHLQSSAARRCAPALPSQSDRDGRASSQHLTTNQTDLRDSDRRAVVPNRESLQTSRRARRYSPSLLTQLNRLSAPLRLTAHHRTSLA